MKQFKTESKRILDLMVNSIYTNKEIFLRELISNASDAIDKLKFLSLTDDKIVSDFSIMLTINKDSKTITVEDNGIGMDEVDLEKNLGTIAESGTLKFKTENKTDNGDDLIGQFGVGFYSAFMVAKRLEVYTKKFNGDVAYKWASNGAEGYTIEQTEKDSVGTKIVMYLKDDDEDYKYSDLLNEFKISSLVKEYSDYIRYPIKMERTRSRKVEGSPDDKPEYENYTEIETLNSMVPLWKKPKAEVTDEMLSDFYITAFRDYEKPLKCVYSKIEGALEYNTILFVPSHAPYDYYSKDYKRGVKLYSNGVLIMDNCEQLLPECYGFIKGIVDSSDISLNISREMLQQSRQVKLIANGLEKKITAELTKMLEENREDYEKMFSEFGLTLKFGAYNGFGAKKDQLKDLLLFHTSLDKKYATLSEYLKRMKDGQEFIYYATGESVDKIDKMPQTEQAKRKGYEVLYLKDGVDEFVLKVLDSYGEKKFKSVSDAGFSFDSEEEKQELEGKQEENKDLIDFIKDCLGDKVKEVKLNNLPSQYASCLTSGGEISIEMEKVLNSMPNANGKIVADKVLEINVSHPVFEKIKSVFSTDKDMVKKYVEVLYCSARLIEGLPLDDVTDFVATLSTLL